MPDLLFEKLNFIEALTKPLTNFWVITTGTVRFGLVHKLLRCYTRHREHLHITQRGGEYKETSHWMTC
jgi:hypothetical protein